MQNANDQQPNGGTAQAKPQIIKLGLDLHARQVTECRQLDGSTPKPAQKWEPGKLLDQVETWVKAGIRVSVPRFGGHADSSENETDEEKGGVSQAL
jgi:hypothetical protein